MSTARTVAVFAIVIGCFAVLYPRVFHPLVLRVFGVEKKTSDDPPRPSHKDKMSEQMRPGEKSDIRNHVRPGPHPGLRASAEMRQQQQAGTGRGMMGVILPMYAVGIVLYLVYTVVKVFNKRQEAHSEAESAAHLRGVNYDQREGKFTFGDDFEAEDDYKVFMNKKDKQRELEKLLLKADERHITEFEMCQLQKRLEETEEQMSRILQAMQAVSEKVETTLDDTSATPNDSASGEVTTEEKAGEGHMAMEVSKQMAGNDQNKTEAACDSSPDSTESFDVVSKTGSSSFSIISTPTDDDVPNIPALIDTISASEVAAALDQSESEDHCEPAGDPTTASGEDVEKESVKDFDVVDSDKNDNDDGLKGKESVTAEYEKDNVETEDILLHDEDSKSDEESSVRKRRGNDHSDNS